ncbi:hypothetical protein ABMA28_016457 [Loxostege sticticalis]|uniref:THAP-type domain-containing protein n=1 Tax=Loxostege sticticalis TaxID=481309 RepID=A0ABD0T9H9_LOXSC
MTNCAVPGCKENGYHLFPKNKDRKKLWAKAIKRPELAKSQCTYLRLCRHHFTENDFRAVKSSTGFKLQRRILKKDAIPSIFPWSKVAPPYSAAREERLRNRNLKKELFPPNSSVSDSAILDSGVSYIDTQKITNNSGTEPQSVGYSDTKMQNINNKSTQTSILLRLFATEELIFDDTSVKFYTGLETHKKFKFVFNTLCPMAYNLCYKSGNVISLSVEDQFLLTLMKLRRNYCNFELSKIFGVSPTVISNIFVTWVNFMFDTWSLIELWPTQELVRYYTPENYEMFKNTRTIIDSTEVPICKPTNPLSQQATFSNYENKNTIKFLIGATPGGLISYCSDGYGGSTSDRQLIERSPLTKLCQAGDVIMADKGFNVQDIFASKNVAVKIPTFLRGSSQLSTYDLRKDRELSKRRVHIERLIVLTKTYTILKSEMNSYYVPLTSKIFFLCVMLCNFRERIVFQFK